VLAPASLRELVPRRRRRGLRAFDSPAAFSGACLRLAAVIGVIGVVGGVDRVFALSLVVLLALFAGLARLVDLDLEDVEPGAAELSGPARPDRAPARPPAAEAPVPAVAPVPAAVVAPPLVRRTFRLPSSVGADVVQLVGDFNGWSRTTPPMRHEGPWFVAEVDLEPGRSYRYRYLLDGERWENDWAADAYSPNCFGSDDSVARADLDRP
jgi:hypothetical protein